MDGRPRRLVHYLTERGTDPYDEWFSRLRDSRAKGRILARLLRAESGNFGDCQPVGNGVFELKIDSGPGYRVYFGLDGSEIAVLLGGGDKGSREADIRTAKERWADYDA